MRNRLLANAIYWKRQTTREDAINGGFLMQHTAIRDAATRAGVWLVPILILAGATGAGAQKVELSPFATLPFGGEFESDRFDFFEFDIDDGSGYGLSVAIDLVGDLQLELFWSHQESDLVEEGGFLLGDFDVTDLDIDYYHAGILYQWGGGQFHPFVTGSLGATEFDPADPFLDNETRFSLGVGGGFKVFFNQSFGLRLEARAFTTVIDEGDDFCDHGDCYYDDGTYFLQGELRGGLIFAF